MPDHDAPLLEVRDLRTWFHTREGTVRAVDGVSFRIGVGETLGLVGESGCGKSITALSILRLVPPPGEVVEGEIFLAGRNLLELPESEIRRVRGGEISMVFQEPASSLNPVFTIGDQISEAILAHEEVSRSEARERAVDLLRRVKIPAAEKRVDEYPHQMSGGMRQRSMLAMALACGPSLLIADEPTTALDVTIQAQIMALLKELQEEFRMSVLMITHNLALVAEVADRIAVMYASKIVESSETRELFSRRPLHPYTRGLLASVPSPRASEMERLEVIPGQVPNPLAFPPGCKFHPRCPLTVERCEREEPEIRLIRPGHAAACHLAEERGEQE